MRETTRDLEGLVDEPTVVANFATGTDLQAVEVVACAEAVSNVANRGVGRVYEFACEVRNGRVVDTTVRSAR